MDAAAGDALKQTGQDAIEETDQAFVERMREVAKEISLKSGHVSVDNLRIWAARYGIEPVHPNSWGCVFKGKHWHIISYHKSAWITNRSRLIAVWRWE